MAQDGIAAKGTKGGFVVAKFNNTGFINLNHPNSLIGANSAGETVTRMNIWSVEWSCANGAYWTIRRGANTIFVLGDGQHVMDMSDARMLDNLGGDPTSNVVVTKTGAGPTTLILKLHKQSTFVSQY